MPETQKVKEEWKHGINRRFFDLLNKMCVKPTPFANSLGLDRADNVLNAYSDKSKIGTDTLELIAEKYPKVNMNWLLTGIGDMFLEDPHNNKLSIVPDKQQDKIEYLIDSIIELQLKSKEQINKTNVIEKDLASLKTAYTELQKKVV